MCYSDLPKSRTRSISYLNARSGPTPIEISTHTRGGLHWSISYSSRIWLGKNEAPEAMDKRLAELKTMIKQLKAFARSPRHVAVIRECVLSYSIRLATRANKAASDKGRKAYTPFVDAFVECLPLFANLKKVDVAEFMLKMDKKILAALASHPSLEEVSLSTVRFGVHLLKPRIKLKRLSISNSDWKDCNPNSSSKYLDMFSGEKLESLSASTTVYAPKFFGHWLGKRWTFLFQDDREDPWDTKLDNMEQLKQKIVGALDLDSCTSYTAHFRTNYMTFLHWIAHKKLQLPSGIKGLFLVDISLSGFLFYSSDSDASDSSSSDGSNGSDDSDNLNSSNNLDALLLSNNDESFFRHLEKKLKFKKNFIHT
ncbi:hypothetical protein CPB84DRAFT_1752493 [Gymnopilus junonius]|uniref:Uncharacterized protein n=1 Tax=Gymnopilus junonius TaxID=109634 RepID=A0A9P5TFY8_GYMJU|nr:hypothetical protein CPB84DRAFT_1752493 [Gymnopilus junonius]